MDDFFKIKMGDIIMAQDHVEFESESGDKLILEKGDKSIIGFDGMIHCLKQRCLIKPDDAMEIEGYSATGLAQFLGAWLDNVFDLEKVLSRTNIEQDDLVKCMEAALVEIGMDAMVREDHTEDGDVENEEIGD